MNWRETAKYVEETYGAFVDWEEEFFECPECWEPVYKCDWKHEPLVDCPVCGFNFFEGEEEEEEEDE